MDILSSNKLSNNIKKYRLKLGLSQDKLARKADMPYTTYLKIESGRTPNPGIQAVINIAKALEISIDKLVS